ncbi:carbohydrate ABC transporter permease [Streptomyces sp. AS02]|uniref:carbohydrate ABC transporter permease n=1 Tax=Streptomyces sp. AS02 TaxID=2938946 RepID=UPI00202207A8|nr:sugar ABC transporter permease [Streptomyces sp. AS02]MCL8017230.1 sugar ABC transporter permease [Streptomyces sp. AS02]
MRVRRWTRTTIPYYLSVSPFFVMFAVFGIFPLFVAGYLSLHRWDGLAPMRYVGFDQFTRLADDPEFWHALLTTLEIFAMSQVPLAVAALSAAFLLSNQRLRLRGLYQTIYFLPQVTSIVVIAIVFASIFGNNYGLINRTLGWLHLPTLDWMTSTWGVNTVIALMIIWRGFGYLVLFFMAGMAAIPPELYEAADLDGARPARQLWSITLPMMRPTIVFAMLTGIVGGMQVFTEPQVLVGSLGTNSPGVTMMLLQYDYIGQNPVAGAETDLGYASAIGWAVFVVVALASLASWAATRATSEKEPN